MRKIIALLVIVSFPILASSQINYYEFKDKQIYFGINMGLNFANFKHKPAAKSLSTDSIRTIQTSLGPGFNLGIISNFQFHKYFDLRFVPTLSFSDKNLNYVLFNDVERSKTISSIYLDFPLSIRYKSEPINDFRIYVLAGIRYDLDLNSNSGKRKAEDQIKIKRHDFAIEYGIGLQFYFEYFIFSPELKVSHGLIDVHSRDEALVFSRVLESLFSRVFTISINLEG